MPKVIWVRGASGSGKTGSIRKFLENRGVCFPRNPKDVRLVLPVKKKGKTYVVGVASAGDTAQHVKVSFNFFERQKCDIIVCASKAAGASMNEMQNQIRRFRAKFVVVPTNKLVGAAATKSAIDQEINAVAKKIEQSIP